MMRLLRNPATLLIHLALVIIITGALVTHFFGVQGSLTLALGQDATDKFTLTSGPGDGTLPWSVSLTDVDISYYPGTETPMDYSSVLSIDGKSYTIAMNSVAETDGWRFYQSGMGRQSSTISISHDPWGIAITYTGYIMAIAGMVGFFFQRRTLWRSLLSAFILSLSSISAQAAPETIQRPLAANLGKIYVYWNDRITPLQTMAIDVTASLYGSRQYRGLTPEQVLAGWLFNYDQWLADYNATHSTPTSEKALKKDNERRTLIAWLGSGAAFRIYPYRTADGHITWLSLTGRRPSQMPLEQWQFMLKTMPDIASDIHRGRNIDADRKITQLIEAQRRYAGDVLPSATRFKAELFYNNYIHLFPAFGIMIIFASAMLWLAIGRKKKYRFIWLIPALSALYLAVVLTLRGIVGQHLPLSNGCETMLFMSFVAAIASAATGNRMLQASLMLVAAMALLVTAMASKTPQIASLMPVLDSPLLSVHVMLVMCSYVLFLLMTVLAFIALCGWTEMTETARLNSTLLLPAVFLLSAGIMAGAVWANQSWGRYWGWDPKETCALITLIVYALPIHRVSLRFFRNPRSLNIYLLAAILSVLFTYFGANYLLPGLHSYA